MQLTQLLPLVIAAAEKAAAAILEIYNSNQPVGTSIKEDKSPVTIADVASHRIIDAELSKISDLPIISEESKQVDFATRCNWRRFWLIDPLDGTREFLKRTDDFAINIALVENGAVILGVVLVPVTGECYYAIKGDAAYKTENGTTRQLQPQQVKTPLQVVASRRHGNKELAKFLEKLPQYDTVNRGSALKICLVAEGKADIYPRLGPTSEWDTAAAQCVLEAVGGGIFNFDFQPLTYNQRDNLKNPNFIAVADLSFNWQRFL